MISHCTCTSYHTCNYSKLRFTQLFSSFVAPLFLECYDLAGNSTRSKKEEMLVTWCTGGPGGIEQLTISRAIWGDMSSGLSGPTPNQVLIELDVLQQVRLFHVHHLICSPHKSASRCAGRCSTGPNSDATRAQCLLAIPKACCSRFD